MAVDQQVVQLEQQRTEELDRIAEIIDDIREALNEGQAGLVWEGVGRIAEIVRREPEYRFGQDNEKELWL